MHHLSTIAVRVRQSRWSFSILTGVCALAAIIISFLMGRNQSLWFDEQYSLLICSKPVRQMLALTAVDAHPPLYYLLLKTWMTLVGGNVAMLRLLNCIFLGATVGIMALLVRSLYGRRVAVACLPLLLCGGFILRYGYELRMYSLAMLLVVFGTYALLRATGSIPAHTQSSTASDTTESLSHHHIHGWHAVYALTVALGMYTLYLTALVWITHVLWLFICSWKDSHESTVVSRLRKLSAFRWIPIYFVSIILYLPWIPSLFGQMGHPVLPPVRRSMNMTGLANAFDAILLGRTESSMPSMASLLALSIGIAVIVRLSIAKPHDRAFLLIATLFVVPLLMMTIWSAVRELVSNGYGFFSVRYLSFTAPFCTLHWRCSACIRRRYGCVLPGCCTQSYCSRYSPAQWCSRRKAITISIGLIPPARHAWHNRSGAPKRIRWWRKTSTPISTPTGISATAPPTISLMTKMFPRVAATRHCMIPRRSYITSII